MSNISVLMMLLVLIVSASGNCRDNDKYEAEAKQWHQQLLDKTKGVLHPMVTPVTLHGLVLDQFGHPIADVNVNASWTTENMLLWKKDIHEIKLKSDVNGRFNFSSYMEYGPSFDKIEKKGYEFHNKNNPYLSLNETNEKETLKNQSESNPILFRLRKLGATTYLHETPYGFKENEYAVSFAFDLANRKYYNLNKNNSLYKHPVNIDLVYDYKRDAATGAHTLRFYVPHKNINLPIVEPAATNGMQLSDTMLYQAPATGYEKEITMTFKPGDEMTKYLYFTSRNPAVYSRMQMYFRASPDDLHLDAETWTNPYGSRNLEYEPDLPADLLIKLMDEAEAALKSGKLPPEPDIPALIASGLYK